MPRCTDYIEDVPLCNGAPNGHALYNVCVCIHTPHPHCVEVQVRMISLARSSAHCSGTNVTPCYVLVPATFKKTSVAKRCDSKCFIHSPGGHSFEPSPFTTYSDCPFWKSHCWRIKPIILDKTRPLPARRTMLWNEGNEPDDKY